MFKSFDQANSTSRQVAIEPDVPFMSADAQTRVMGVSLWIGQAN